MSGLESTPYEQPATIMPPGETAMHHRSTESSDEMLAALVGVPLEDLSRFLETWGRLWEQTGGWEKARNAKCRCAQEDLEEYSRLIDRAAKRLMRGEARA